MGRAQNNHRAGVKPVVRRSAPARNLAAAPTVIVELGREFTAGHPAADARRVAQLRCAFFGQPVENELYPHILGMLDQEQAEQLARAEEMMLFMPDLAPERALALAGSNQARRSARLAA